MRRTVEAEISSASSESTSSRASSVQSHWDRLRPHLSGLSQAIFTRWRATSGGKDGWTPGARLVSKAMDSLFTVAFKPLVDNGRGNPDTTGDLSNGMSLRAEKDHPCSTHSPCTCSCTPLQGLQFATFPIGKRNHQRRLPASCHECTLLDRLPTESLAAHPLSVCRVVVFSILGTFL